jgi:hypothetical protein
LRKNRLAGPDPSILAGRSAAPFPLIKLDLEARAKVATIAQLKYQARKYETAGKTFEFSRIAMEEHWQAGYEDTKVALGEPAVVELPNISEAARIFDVHRGWLK